MRQQPHDLETGSSSSSSEDEYVSPSHNDEKLTGGEKARYPGPEEEVDGGDALVSDDEPDHSSADDHHAPASAGSSGRTKAKFIPVTLAFKNLFFSVKVRKGKNPFQKKYHKTLLKDLHAELRPGEVTAIMGPSGTPSSGETALCSGPSFGKLLITPHVQERARRRCSTCWPAACKAARSGAPSPSTTYPRTTFPTAHGRGSVPTLCRYRLVICPQKYLIILIMIK
jgi:hypothetical protein